MSQSRSTLSFRQLGQGRVSFPKQEEEILQLWRDIKAFETQLEKSRGRPPFTFYDGPPFATGLPHYGHILAGTIKDVVCRYATMTGHHVERTFGWDCHGLPVESAIEKKLEITSRDQIVGPDGIGIERYNAECRKIVMRCVSDWERTVERCGRWIDFEHAYKTLDLPFMESVWWVFKQLVDKDLVYRGYKVMPFSPALNTPLSNFEAKSSYKNRKDPAVIVNFPVRLPDGTPVPNEYFLAWTTTPWTLPSNLALCVNSDLDYVKLQNQKDNKVYIVGAQTLATIKKGVKGAKLKQIEGPFKGSTLVGLRYEPLFNFFADDEKTHEEGPRYFRVLSGDYVSATDGTAIVHQAPGFGEDDFSVCMNHGVIEKGEIVPCPVDMEGRFVAPVMDYEGQFVLDANKDIMKDLKSRERVWSQNTIDHEYPYCWRSDQPLIYRTIPSWFVRVESLKERLLASNEKTYWVPDFVKEKRFHNWLENARDWAVSRNRYWGTPLPIWISDDGEEWEVMESVAELEARSETTGITDIHRESIDHITITSSKTGKTLRRVDEVFDCWFESGSMPYAQVHYPFAYESKEEFLRTRFPADFIAEGLDQTRGWFYTLLVLSTALFDEPAWKNLIVNGLVLARDGKKMSKRLKNYPDPNIILNTHGADALRLYLCNSPVVRAEPLAFKEEGVRDVIKDVFLPWWNAYKFFVENASRYERETGVAFRYNEGIHREVTNEMDRWILSELQSLVKFTRQEIEAYRLYTVVPELLKFLNLLTNWYVRTNRDRLRGRTSDPSDVPLALGSLYNVLLTLCQLMAPLTPFITEAMYQNLKFALDNAEDSVHFLLIPEVIEEAIDANMERRVKRMQTVVELARSIRVQSNLPNKTPLREVTVVHQDSTFLEDVAVLEAYVREELNVKHVRFSNELTNFITLTCEPVNSALGKQFGRKRRALVDALGSVSHEDLMSFSSSGLMTLLDEELTPDHVKVVWNFTGDSDTFGSASNSDTLVVMDVTVDAEMEMEGIARDCTSKMQRMRKDAQLEPSDKVLVYYSKPEGRLDTVFEKFRQQMEETTRLPVLPAGCRPDHAVSVLEQSVEIDGQRLDLALVKPHVFVNDEAFSAKFQSKQTADGAKVYLSSKNMDALERDYPIGSTFSFVLGDETVDLVVGEDFSYQPMGANAKAL